MPIFNITKSIDLVNKDQSLLIKYFKLSYLRSLNLQSLADHIVAYKHYHLYNKDGLTNNSCKNYKLYIKTFFAKFSDTDYLEYLKSDVATSHKQTLLRLLHQNSDILSVKLKNSLVKFIVMSPNTKLSYKKYYLQNFVTKINITKDIYDRFIYPDHQSWYLYIDIFILNNYDDYLQQMLKTHLMGYLDKLDVLHYLADMSVECRNSLRLISPSHYLRWIYKNTISIDYIISNDIATIISSLKSCTDRNQLKYCILFLLKIDLQYITDVYSILKSHNLTFEDLICND